MSGQEEGSENQESQADAAPAASSEASGNKNQPQENQPGTTAGEEGAKPKVDPKIDAFNNLLMAVQDPEGQTGLLFAMRETMSGYDEQIAKAGEGEEKTELLKRREKEEKSYQAELADFRPKLEQQIKDNTTDIDNLCGQLNPPQTPEQVKAMDQESIGKLNPEEQNKVEAIRKKQEELENQKKLQAQLAAPPPPAPTPQLPKKTGQNLGVEVGDKKRPELDQKVEEGMWDQMHKSILLNIILFLLSKKTPMRYILAAATLYTAKVTGMPVQAVRFSFSKAMSKHYSNMGDTKNAERWSEIASKIDIMNPVDVRKSMTGMLEREQADSLLARKLFESFCIRPGISNETARENVQAPQGNQQPEGPNAAFQGGTPKPQPGPAATNTEDITAEANAEAKASASSSAELSSNPPEPAPSAAPSTAPASAATPKPEPPKAPTETASAEASTPSVAERVKAIEAKMSESQSSALDPPPKGMAPRNATTTTLSTDPRAPSTLSQQATAKATAPNPLAEAAAAEAKAKKTPTPEPPTTPKHKTAGL